ncbi:MAG: hypothetical protein JNK38_14585 [Acidobacteria bacterium]|nr:hypothetical protein [Acidobacteriota bacterium]
METDLWKEWQESYQPADEEALKTLARAVFLSDFLKIRQDEVFTLIAPIMKAIGTYWVECYTDGIHPVAVDPAYFVDLFEIETEGNPEGNSRNPNQLRLYYPDQNDPFSFLCQKSSRRAIQVVKEQSQTEVIEWCNSVGLDAIWCRDHVSASVRTFLRSWLYWLLPAWKRVTQQQSNEFDSGKDLSEAHLNFIDRWFGAMYAEIFNQREFVGSAWSKEVSQLRQQAEKARSIPGLQGDLNQSILHALRAVEGKEPPRPELPPHFALPDHELLLEEARKRGRDWIIVPGRFSRLTQSGGVKPRELFLAEIREDLEQCFEILRDIPVRYLPDDLRRSFINQAWKRCEEELEPFNQEMDSYMQSVGYGQIKIKPNFGLQSERLVYRLAGWTDKDVALQELKKEANDPNYEPRHESVKSRQELIRQGAKWFATVIGLDLRPRK